MAVTPLTPQMQVAVGLALAAHLLAIVLLAANPNTPANDNSHHLVVTFSTPGKLPDQAQLLGAFNQQGQVQNQAEQVPAAATTPEFGTGTGNTSLSSTPATEATAAIAATRATAHAEYLMHWQQQVEAAGNALYSAQPDLRQLQGDVTLLVSLDAQGELAAVRLIRSGGQALLDQLALQSVQNAAPFQPPQAGLLDSEGLLHIRRTWQFRQAQISTH